MMQVKAWTEQVTIPTYRAGKPEKNPMFLEKRVYQGSSGVVYPHPVIEQISDEKTPVSYNAVFLENEYLLIMILPELGGRIQRAYDKVRQRDFVYYNQVIKPALVGLAGPWISGGIEFNWPQHHRPSTFSPVDYTIEENADGSKTVWVNEVELMFRTKGMAGFTLHSDKAYLEIKGRLFNRSPFPQTFLWWANPAVKVNEYYRSVFPPDVYAVFDHGKRDVSDFPIATGTYYKVNYAPGTDISRYSTIPVPTSYMAIRSKYDFIGCYEDDTQAGMLHVANHHFSPGKKQWTWGNGDFGYAWDRNLTDEDGPYIELMTGVFTDNQPDFTWIQPNEGKDFEQYFMPYAKIGAVKNATKEAMLNMEWNAGQLSIKVYATAVYNHAVIRLVNKGELVKEYRFDLSPDHVFEETYIPEIAGLPEDWELAVKTETGMELVAYRPEAVKEKEIPQPAMAAKLPTDIEQVEDLFLTGLHLEQYRHATFNPVDYYEEGLKRSPSDVRCNNAMGLLLLRRGQFAKAEPYLRKAIETITRRNPNPYDGEPYYNLGWCLLLQGKEDNAYEAFYKATWSDAWQHSGFLALARIAAKQGRIEEALQLINKSLTRNYHSHSARHIKAVLLRMLGQLQECIAFAAESLQIDPFNFGCLWEQSLAETQIGHKAAAAGTVQNMQALLSDKLNNYLETALDYAYMGMYPEALQLLQLSVDRGTSDTPMLHYYMGWLALQTNDHTQAAEHFAAAAQKDPALCFPNKVEEINILQSAVAANPTDYAAYYLLGNCWYDKRQYAEAIDCWEKAAVLNNRFPTVLRNLSLAYYNKTKDRQKAVSMMEKAFALDTTDARVLMELDQLYKIMGKPARERLAFLDRYQTLIEQRDDLYLERITLKNSLHAYEEAKTLLSARRFHPWEGGEGKVVGQYLLSHIELAKQAINEQQYTAAITLLEAAGIYPDNLGEGKLYGVRENDIDYLRGLAYEGLNRPAEAETQFRKATVGIGEPAQAIYYNDPQPDKIVYQALAWLKLGEAAKATAIFERFIQFAGQHINDKVTIDYFAVSLPDMLVFDIDINQRNREHCLYLAGLGNLGLGQYDAAKAGLEQVLASNGNHRGAMTYLEMFPFFKAALQEQQPA